MFFFSFFVCVCAIIICQKLSSSSSSIYCENSNSTQKIIGVQFDKRKIHWSVDCVALFKWKKSEILCKTVENCSIYCVVKVLSWRIAYFPCSSSETRAYKVQSEDFSLHGLVELIRRSSGKKCLRSWCFILQKGFHSEKSLPYRSNSF